MTDPTRSAPLSHDHDLRRWPTDPAQLVDTTLCPACFSRLGDTTCGVCGLELAVPEASDLLAASKRVYDAERDRQQLLGRVRSQQSVRRSVRHPVEAAVGSIHVTLPAAPAVPAAPPETEPAAPRGSEAPSHPLTPTGAPPARTGAAQVATGNDGGVRAPRRSAVQVLLLTLGVVLLSVAAVVFLFVAYLVASLEVRSIIIAAASVLVLGLAWLLRTRRLPGTAEGVASVAVVLLVLDVWTVRANDVFGTESLPSPAYWGGALLVVAALLAVTRVVTGVRVPGFAAAAVTPVAVFLLALGVVPESDPGTALWLGFLAAAIAGATGLLVRASPERTIVLAEGFGAGALALVAAAWALPDVPWGRSWAYGAVAAVWLAGLGAMRLPTAGVRPVWHRIAAVVLGAAAALAAALGVAAELEQVDAAWVAPVATAAVACVLAALTLPAVLRADARSAFVSAAGIAAAAALPALALGIGSVVSLLFDAGTPWELRGDERSAWIFAEFDMAVVLTPAALAAAAVIALACLGRLRTVAAVPLGLAMFAIIVLAAVAPGISLAALVLLVLAGGCLAIAAVPAIGRVRGAIPTLALAGTAAAALAWVIAPASVDIWPWTTVSVLLLAVAGRILAPRLWGGAAVVVLGIAQLVVAATVFATAMALLPRWADAAGRGFPVPWDVSWMWTGTAGAVVIAALAFAARLRPRDRVALVAPLFAIALLGATALAIDPPTALGWMPGILLAVAGALWLRPAAPTELRVAFAAATPVAAALGFAALLGDRAGADAVALGLAGVALVSAGLAHAVHRLGRTTTLAWTVSLGFVGLVALGVAVVSAADPWLVLLFLTPIPVVVAALDGDPIGGNAPSRHLSWLSLGLAVATSWTWMAGDSVAEVEAYSLPLAVGLAVAGALISWRRTPVGSSTAGRTALIASAVAIAVLASVGSSADSELRTLVLSSCGVVALIAGPFLPEHARGVPLRLIAVVAGWSAVTGAALVRGSAVAAGEPSALIPEFWPLIALVAGVFASVAWARAGSAPAWLAESGLAASVALAAVPTMVAIAYDDRAEIRAAALLSALAAAHVANAAAARRPFAGPAVGWSSLGALVVCSSLALLAGTVEPFDVATVPVAVALIGAGAWRMRRSPALGSWPALGPGLGVLMVPWLIADWADPELWRIVALGVVSAAAVVLGAARRLQAPLLLGASVLLVHSLTQLWPWITALYAAVWWWLWLAIAGALLIAIAATYERQLRLARGVARSIVALR